MLKSYLISWAHTRIIYERVSNRTFAPSVKSVCIVFIKLHSPSPVVLWLSVRRYETWPPIGCQWGMRHGLILAGITLLPLRWRYNGCDGVSYHQPHHCLPNLLFRHGSKKTSKLRVTGLCAGISSVTGEFPASHHKWPVTRKMFPFDEAIMVFGWSKHRLGLTRVAMNCGPMWPVEISTVFQRPPTVLLRGATYRQISTVRSVQGDCETVYLFTQRSKLDLCVCIYVVIISCASEVFIKKICPPNKVI